MHRKWSLQDVQTQFQEAGSTEQKKAAYLRFYCEGCGTVSHSMSYTDCKACGRKTEKV
jgi:ribosomal protein S27E